MADANQFFDRMAIAPMVGVSLAKVILSYHTSLLRLWADNCEQMLHYYENGLEKFGSAVEQRRDAACSSQ
jgi:hypothetical protein